MDKRFYTRLFEYEIIIMFYSTAVLFILYLLFVLLIES